MSRANFNDAAVWAAPMRARRLPGVADPSAWLQHFLARCRAMGMPEEPLSVENLTRCASIACELVPVSHVGTVADLATSRKENSVG